MSKATKNDLISTLQTNNELSAAEAKRWLEAVVDAIVENAQEYDAVSVCGLGTLRKYAIPEREHRNPQTGGRVTAPPHTKVRFKPAPRLDRAVN